MDFNKLMQTMRDLDQPTAESQVVEQPIVADECGDMGPMGGMSPAMSKPDTPPPSMSVNLNAQGLDDIAELMKLMTKVNPDMINQPAPIIPPAMPPMGMPDIKPSIMPLKMLPDFDKDNDDMPGGEMDQDDSPMIAIKKAMGDDEGDIDSDMEKKDDKKEEEAFGNSVAGDEGPDYKAMSAAIPDGNDLHKQKGTYRTVAGGDNPMAMEGGELRAAIRAELLQRLAEAKGAK